MAWLLDFLGDRRRARSEPAAGLAGGDGARPRHAARAPSAPHLLLGVGLRALGPAQDEAGLRADGAGVLRPHDDERRRGRAADAHRHLDPRLRHRHVDRDGRARRARAAPADRARLRGGRLALRDGPRRGSRATSRAIRASGEVPERHRTGSQRVVPFQGFETQDRHHDRGRGQRSALRQARGRARPPGVGQDERFATNAARVGQQAALCSSCWRRSSSRAPRASGSTCWKRRRPVRPHPHPARGGHAAAGPGPRHHPAPARRRLRRRSPPPLLRRPAAPASAAPPRASASTTARSSGSGLNYDISAGRRRRRQREEMSEFKT